MCSCTIISISTWIGFSRLSSRVPSASNGSRARCTSGCRRRPNPSGSSGRRAQLPPDRHVLDATDEARARALQLARGLDVLHPLGQPRHDHLQLEPREMRAEADVLSDAEAEMRIRIAVDT